MTCVVTRAARSCAWPSVQQTTPAARSTKARIVGVRMLFMASLLSGKLLKIRDGQFQRERGRPEHRGDEGERRELRLARAVASDRDRASRTSIDLIDGPEDGRFVRR